MVCLPTRPHSHRKNIANCERNRTYHTTELYFDHEFDFGILPLHRSVARCSEWKCKSGRYANWCPRCHRTPSDRRDRRYLDVELFSESHEGTGLRMPRLL